LSYKLNFHIQTRQAAASHMMIASPTWFQGPKHESQTQIAPTSKRGLKLTRGPHYYADATMAVPEPY